MALFVVIRRAHTDQCADRHGVCPLCAAERERLPLWRECWECGKPKVRCWEAASRRSPANWGVADAHVRQNSSPGISESSRVVDARLCSGYGILMNGGEPYVQLPVE